MTSHTVEKYSVRQLCVSQTRILWIRGWTRVSSRVWEVRDCWLRSLLMGIRPDGHEIPKGKLHFSPLSQESQTPWGCSPHKSEACCNPPSRSSRTPASSPSPAHPRRQEPRAPGWEREQSGDGTGSASALATPRDWISRLLAHRGTPAALGWDTARVILSRSTPALPCRPEPLPTGAEGRRDCLALIPRCEWNSPPRGKSNCTHFSLIFFYRDSSQHGPRPAVSRGVTRPRRRRRPGPGSRREGPKGVQCALPRGRGRCSGRARRAPPPPPSPRWAHKGVAQVPPGLVIPPPRARCRRRRRCIPRTAAPARSLPRGAAGPPQQPPRSRTGPPAGAGCALPASSSPVFPSPSPARPAPLPPAEPRSAAAAGVWAGPGAVPGRPSPAGPWPRAPSGSRRRSTWSCCGRWAASRPTASASTATSGAPPTPTWLWAASCAPPAPASCEWVREGTAGSIPRQRWPPPPAAGARVRRAAAAGRCSPAAALAAPPPPLRSPSCCRLGHVGGQRAGGSPGKGGRPAGGFPGRVRWKSPSEPPVRRWPPLAGCAALGGPAARRWSWGGSSGG